MRRQVQLHSDEPKVVEAYSISHHLTGKFLVNTKRCRWIVFDKPENKEIWAVHWPRKLVLEWCNRQTENLPDACGEHTANKRCKVSAIVPLPPFRVYLAVISQWIWNKKKIVVDFTKTKQSIGTQLIRYTDLMYTSQRPHVSTPKDQISLRSVILYILWSTSQEFNVKTYRSR